MSRALARMLAAWLLLAVMPAVAQTRAWLDRAEISEGETVALNIATDQPVDQIDYGPLRAQFELGGQSVRRSFEWVNGRSQRTSVFSVGLRPRTGGLLVVPPLQVGKARTASLRLVVLPPAVEPANRDADVFLQTDVDARQPYVQQAVGVTVRLNYAIPLLSGQLELEAPPGASLQRVGEDVTYQRLLEGRRYNVVERRYLLIPERSGPLLLPGARLNGITGAGFIGTWFEDERRPVSAASPATPLQVLPIPADAPTPWLPLRALQLRYLQAPTQGWTGTAVTVEIEAVADGASAAQMPVLTLPEVAGVQQFAEPVQLEERFVDGRPRTVARRKFALVPTHPGRLEIPGPTLAWWDAGAHAARTARLPPLRLQIAAGAGSATSAAPTAPAAKPAAVPAQPQPAAGHRQTPAPAWPWWALAAGLLLAGIGCWRYWPGRGRPRVAAPQPTLAAALRRDDPAEIMAALARAAGVSPGDFEALCAWLDAPAQVQALQQLQAARWKTGQLAAALAAVRTAFAAGPRWRQARPSSRSSLPPLYPP